VGKFDSMLVNAGEHIAFNVKQHPTNGFEFNLSGFDETTTFCTQYGWSLIEISDANLLLLAERNKVEAKQKELSSNWKHISSMIKTIENQGVQHNEDMVSDSTE
jgi:hypothetical protein